MEYVVLGVALVGAAFVGAGWRRRRRDAARRLDVPRLVAAAVARADAPPATTAADPVARALTAGPREPAATPTLHDVIEERTDTERFRPKLADGVEVVYFRLRWGNDYAMVGSPDHDKHFQLEVWEAELVELMDGNKTLGELIVDHLERRGDLDAGAVIGLVESLRLAGLFDPAPVDVQALVGERLDPASERRKMLRRFAKEQKVSWRGADRFTRALYDRGLKYVFRPTILVLASILALAGLVAFWEVVSSGRYDLTIGNPPVQTVILMVLGFALTFAHEMAHALVLVHYGRRIGSSGFLLYYGSLAFYVDASDGLMLSSGRRIIQASAGPFAELALAGVSSVLLFLFPGWGIAPFLYKFSFLNYYVIALNLIPLLELDGYWILSDAIQVDDLRPRSLAFIQRDFWRKLARRERFTRQEVGLALYGVVGLAFTILTLAVGIVFWQATFGTLLGDLWAMGLWARVLLFFLVLFLAGPAIRGLVAAWRSVARRVRAVIRRIRFKVESSWRVEAAGLIDALPVFDDLPVDLLNDLAGRVRLRTVPRDQAIFRQGDRSDAFYVVRSGRVAIEDVDPITGDTRVLTVLARGDSFGELGLLQHVPRSATTRAMDEVELFEVDRATFDRLLADTILAPDFAPTMQAYAQLSTLPPFRTLTFAELAELHAHGSWLEVRPGTVVVEQGAVGDAFYVIGTGQVDVSTGGKDVATLGPGAYFGEVALLEDVPRTASVIARTPAHIFRLDRVGFDSFVADSFHRGSLRRAADRTWHH